ncbi:MAG TPA: class I SAM-dependent methyltransferase [Thermoanaerobaculia bacterium]|nr:class I SAM-dependent methyltransferase [Thermoanaerobaculia bacterium]
MKSRPVNEFVGTLEDRKKAERDWANFSRDTHNPHAVPGQTSETARGNFKWYSTTQRSMEYRCQWLLQNVPGKVFIDYACGNGDNAIEAAKLGAALAIGIDISEISIQNATQAAEREGLSDRCIFFTGDCENTGLPENSIDVILCSYMLHHLDLNHAYPEMHRILKPGGVVFAAEALDYNPAIKAYRMLTPEMRTEWEKEHILSLKDVRLAKKWFNVGAIHYWHMASIAGAFVRRVPPLFNVVMPVLNAFDDVLTRIPGVQLMAWQFSFELIKPSG